MIIKYVCIWLLIFIVVELICLFVYFQSIGFRKVEYSVSSNVKLPRDISICFLSDMHNADSGNNNKELLEAIDNIAPDMIILGGDIITKIHRNSPKPDKTIDFLERLSGKYRVIYGIGNHEHYNFHPTENGGKPNVDEVLLKEQERRLRDFLTEKKIELLEDAHVDIPEYGCVIHGIDLPLTYFRRFVTQNLNVDEVIDRLGRPIDGRYNILIAHNPDHFKTYCEWGADLVFSGHVHGGIVRIPGLGGVLSPSLKLFPKYDGGVFYEKNSTMVLGRGIGWHSIPIRIFNKAELVHVVIKSSTE